MKVLKLAGEFILGLTPYILGALLIFIFRFGLGMG